MKQIKHLVPPITLLIINNYNLTYQQPSVQHPLLRITLRGRVHAPEPHLHRPLVLASLQIASSNLVPDPSDRDRFLQILGQMLPRLRGRLEVAEAEMHLAQRDQRAAYQIHVRGALRQTDQTGHAAHGAVVPSQSDVDQGQVMVGRYLVTRGVMETSRNEQQILGDLQRGRHFSRVERRLEILQRRLGEIVHLFVRHFRFCQLIARHAGGRLSFPVAFVIVEVAVSQFRKGKFASVAITLYRRIRYCNVGNFEQCAIRFVCCRPHRYVTLNLGAFHVPIHVGVDALNS